MNHPNSHRPKTFPLFLIFQLHKASINQFSILLGKYRDKKNSHHAHEAKGQWINKSRDSLWYTTNKLKGKSPNLRIYLEASLECFVFYVSLGKQQRKTFTYLGTPLFQIDQLRQTSREGTVSVSFKQADFEVKTPDFPIERIASPFPPPNWITSIVSTSLIQLGSSQSKRPF